MPAPEGLLPGFQPGIPQQKPGSASGAAPEAGLIREDQPAFPAPAAEHIIQELKADQIRRMLVDELPVSVQRLHPDLPGGLADAEEGGPFRIPRIPADQIHDRGRAQGVAGEDVGFLLQHLILLRGNVLR